MCALGRITLCRVSLFSFLFFCFLGVEGEGREKNLFSFSHPLHETDFGKEVGEEGGREV